MKKYHSDYFRIILFAVAFGHLGCSQSKKGVNAHDLTDGGRVVATVGGNQEFSIMIAKPSGLLAFEGPTGKISVSCKINESPSVLHELNSGVYSFVLDKDGDGFPETGVNRNTGARVKFSVQVNE